MGFLSPSPPSVPELPPVPKREDPSVSAARKAQRVSERKRRGRAASILTSQEAGQLGEAPVARPGLRTSRLLGG